jgi:amidophosphoribosyltransferase
MERSDRVLTEIRGLNEECGIFGIWGHPEAPQVTYYGLHTLQHRGQEGCGIVANNRKNLLRHKGVGLVSEVFTKDSLEYLYGIAAIGHVRYATKSKGDISNIQPFLFHFEEGSWALCHNGSLVNAMSLRRELEGKGSIFQTNSDSELLAHLIKRTPRAHISESLRDALTQIKGGFAYILLTENEMMAARDPNGIRPLSIGTQGEAYVVASETCAFDAIGAEFLRDVEPGELIIINDKGLTSLRYSEDANMAICSMEFIYFSRPDSNIGGVNVHTARKNMGKTLAKESPTDADVIVAAPDSGISAAIGYSETTGLPYEIGLIKNRYVARTFIQPSQSLREQGVKMKFSAVRGVVEGKRVVLIDDSLVRGTTTKRLVTLLKDAGAKEVHMKIACPPLKYPCFYGIDIQNTNELIAHHHSIEEIRQKFDLESLSFLSENGFINAVNLPYPGKYKGLCMAYFNGDYPTPLYDFANWEE